MAAESPVPAAAIEEISPEVITRAAEAVRTSAKRTREVFAADFGSLSALAKAPQPAIASKEPSPYDATLIDSRTTHTILRNPNYFMFFSHRVTSKSCDIVTIAKSQKF